MATHESLSAEAEAVFGDQVAAYARVRGIDQASAEVQTLRLALHLAWDGKGWGNILHPDRIMAAAIIVTYCRHNGGFAPHQLVANILTCIYRRHFLWWEFPLRPYRANLKAVEWLVRQGRLVDNLAIDVFSTTRDLAA